VFWKRKGKKKVGDEAEGSGVSAATPTSTDTEDTSAADASAEPDGAADGKAQAQKGAPAESGESETSSDIGSDAGSGVGDSDPDTEPEESGDDVPAAAGGKDGEKGAAADESADGDHSEESGSGDEEGDEDIAPAARRKRSPTVEEDPEVPGKTEPDEEGVQRVRTVGVLKAEDQEIDVVSNTWIVDADDEGVIVIDPAHDAEAIMEAVGEREVYLVACTNGYNTHIAAAIEVAERDEAPIALHRRELRPWRRVHGAEHRPDLEIEGGGSLKAGDVEVDILPIPGTASGSVAYYISEKGVAFTGDSLRAGEVGTVAGGYLDYTQQLHSIGEMILTLPPDTRVLPDSGPETTVEEESANFDTWVTTG